MHESFIKSPEVHITVRATSIELWKLGFLIEDHSMTVKFKNNHSFLWLVFQNLSVIDC